MPQETKDPAVEQMSNNTLLEASRIALEQEFPDCGIIIIIADTRPHRENFSMIQSPTLSETKAADILRHARSHVLKEPGHEKCENK